MLKRVLLIPFLLACLCTSVNGQVLIGATTYSGLDTAFNAINWGAKTGNIVIYIYANITGANQAVLLPSGSGPSSYTSITIRPLGGNFTISGNHSISLIYLAGADNVTIDGLNSGGQSLTISNLNTSGGSAVRMGFGACNNTINRCTLLGAGTSFTGVVMFTKDTLSNIKNTITNCNIGGNSGGRPAYGILAAGDLPPTTPAIKYTDSITILNNNIYDYSANNSHSLGIYTLDGNSGWTIQGNRFYQTGSRSISNSGATKYHGAIWIYSQTFNSTFTIKDNIIGYSSSSGTGTYQVTGATTTSYIAFLGITIATGSGITTNLDNNKLKNISFTSYDNSLPFIGIFINSSGTVNLGNTTGNELSGVGYYVATSSSSGSVPLYGIYYNASAGLINNSSIGNITILNTGSTSTLPISFYGIYATGTLTSVSSNTIGGAASSIMMGNYYNAPSQMVGIWVSTSSGPTISNNIVNGLDLLDYNAGAYVGGIDLNISTAPVSVFSNTVRNLSSNSRNASTSSRPSIYGINLVTTTSGNIFYSNRINNLKNISGASGVTPSVAGVILGAGTASNSTFRGNYIYDLGVNSSTPGSYCDYLYIGSGNWNVNNNMFSSPNSLNKTLNQLEVVGGTVNLIFNSFYIGGTTAFASNSCNLKRTGGTIISVSNLFYNGRSSASGGYSCNINVPPSSAGYSPNYNLHVCPDTTKVLFDQGTLTYKSFQEYYSSFFTSDRAGWAELSAQINPSLFFTDATNGDLSINTSSQLCWYVSGKGWPMAAYDYDYALTSGTRSNSISTGAPDIGADEFSTGTAPLPATHTGSFTAGGTSTYYQAGRAIAQINWQAGSSLPPSAPTVLYYTGSNPPYPISGTKSLNAYWHISATNVAGMSYTLKLRYTDALLYNVTSATNLRIAKNSGSSSTAWGYATSNTLDATNKTIYNPATYNSFSFFTGTDATAPLPVEWLDFKATKVNDEALLSWSTATETNNSHFEIEHSLNGVDFEPIGKVKGNNNSNKIQHYTFTHTHLSAGYTHYYRIKQVDFNGEFSYSSVQFIQSEKMGSFTVFPNPFTDELVITNNAQLTGNALITLTDLNGKVVYSREVNFTNNESIQIQKTNEMRKGIYFLSILNNGELLHLKVVAQ